MPVPAKRSYEAARNGQVDNPLANNPQPRLPPMPSRIRRNSTIIRHQRAPKIQRCRDQQPISWIAPLIMRQPICARRSAPRQRNGRNARTSQKTFHPGLSRAVQTNPPRIRKYRDLPGGNRADENCTPRQPKPIDNVPCPSPQSLISGIKPKHHMRVQQHRIRQGSAAPSTSISSSITGATRSTPSRTDTEPGCAPNNDPERASRT